MDSRLRGPVRLTEGVWRLGNHHIASFLIRGKDRAAIFEAGVGATAPLVLAQLDALGVTRSEVGWVVLSHSHADHACGQAGLMAGLPGASLLMTAASLKHLSKTEVARRFEKEDAFTAEALGLGRERVSTLPLLPGPVALTEPGQSLNLGNLTLEFMSGDGHAPGGITAWVPEEGVVFSSDSAGFRCGSGARFPLYFVSFERYMANLANLAALRPSVLALGHQKWFTANEASVYLRELQSELHAERLEIVRNRARGDSDEDQARRLADHYYREELTIYPPEGILHCCRLLVRRSLEVGETSNHV